MTVSDTPVRLATMAVWSMNLSAPDSRRKSAETKTAALYATELVSAMVGWGLADCQGVGTNERIGGKRVERATKRAY